MSPHGACGSWCPAEMVLLLWAPQGRHEALYGPVQALVRSSWSMAACWVCSQQLWVWLTLTSSADVCVETWAFDFSFNWVYMCKNLMDLSNTCWSWEHSMANGRCKSPDVVMWRLSRLCRKKGSWILSLGHFETRVFIMAHVPHVPTSYITVFTEQLCCSTVQMEFCRRGW